VEPIAVIVNPTAGPARRRVAPDTVAEQLRNRGFAPEVQVTRRPGEAADLARDAARRCRIVLAVGGDGTVSEVARGLLGTAAALAVLPTGSGNDLAGDLGVSSLEAGWRTLRHGRLVRRDVGWFGDEPFFNSCGLLLSGEVSLLAARLDRRWGAGRYLLASAAGILRHRSVRAEWRFAAPAGDDDLAGDWSLAEIGLGRTTGGGFRLTPRADPADGLLDVCLVAGMGRGRLLRLLPRGMRGNHLDLDGVHYRQVVEVTCHLAAPTAVHLDGEARPLPAGTYRWRCEPRALTVLADPSRTGEARHG